MGKVRDNRIDTLKGFLILSVVFGHFFTHDASHGIVSETMANFIYSFHMPLFVFVSGYFSNNQKVIKGGVRLLETYLVYQLIKGIAYGYSVLWMFIMPAPMLWYLFALIFWRLLYAGLDKIGIKVTWHLLLVLVCLSVAAGFVPWIGREYALSRFIVFAPYFFFGVMIKDMQIIDVVKKKFNLTLCIGILLVALTIGIVCAVYSINIRTVFSGTSPYPSDKTWIYALARLLCYLTSFFISISFIRVFSFENKIMGTVGKDSLKYYMFHGLFLMAVEFFELPWSTVFAVIYASVVSIVIFFFNKTQLSDIAITPVSFVIDKIRQRK